MKAGGGVGTLTVADAKSGSMIAIQADYILVGLPYLLAPRRALSKLLVDAA